MRPREFGNTGTRTTSCFTSSTVLTGATEANRACLFPIAARRGEAHPLGAIKRLISRGLSINWVHFAEKPDAVVVVAEGEKAADAAQRLLPQYVVTTSSGGSKAAKRADWSPLKGRAILIWPDADKEGYDYACAVAKLARVVGAKSIAIARLPEGLPKGWDAADAEADGWDSARAVGLIGAASVITEFKKPSTHSRKRLPQRDAILPLFDECEFWKDEDSEVYVTIPENGHQEHWKIRSPRFRRWITGRYYKATSRAIGGQALEDTLRVLEARAHEGRTYKTWRRVALGLDGALYLDLCDWLGAPSK